MPAARAAAVVQALPPQRAAPDPAAPAGNAGTGDQLETVLAAQLLQLELLPRVDLDAAERRAAVLLAAAGGRGLTELSLRAWLVQADVLERRGEIAASAPIAREVQRWATAHSARYLLARSHYVLEAVHVDLGDAATALEHAVSAVELLVDTDPPVIRFDHLVRLTDCKAVSGSMEAARADYPMVLRLAEDLADVDRQLLVLNNWAYFEHLAGNFAESLAFCHRMQALAARHRMPLHMGRVDTTARALIGLGRYAEAEQLMRPALHTEALRSSPDGDSAAECTLTLAEIQRRLGDTVQAQRTLDECVRLCRENGLAGVAVKARCEQAAVHAAEGRFSAAYEVHRIYHAEAIAMQSAQREASARAAQAVYETTEARRQSSRYRELSLRDPLTGLYNRRYVDDEVPDLVRRGTGSGDVVTIALVDLDHFKDVNDTCSHDVGDKVLCVVADLLQATAAAGSPGAFAARMGGEEFLLVLPGADTADAVRQLDGFCRTVRRHPWVALTGQVPVTVSIGATAVARQDPATVADLLARADAHLYTAKDTGRDRVVADEPGAGTPPEPTGMRRSWRAG